MPLNLPIILTLFRVLLMPVFIGTFYLPYDWAPLAAAFVFFLAGLTDYFDGYFARKWNQTTPFGAFLDPVADKVMVALALILIVQDYNSAWVTIPALIMIGREIVISALREWMAEMGNRGVVAVSWIGKYKTAAQMTSITGLLWKPNEIIIYLAYGLFYIATALTIWSMVSYILASWKYLVVKK